jgi:hypothetical protein
MRLYWAVCTSVIVLGARWLWCVQWLRYEPARKQYTRLDRAFCVSHKITSSNHGSAVIFGRKYGSLVLKLQYNKRRAYVERPIPPSSKRRPHFETCTCLGDNKYLGRAPLGVWSQKLLCWWRPAAISRPTDSQSREGKNSDSAFSTWETGQSEFVADRRPWWRRRSPIVVFRCAVTKCLVVM